MNGERKVGAGRREQRWVGERTRGWENVRLSRHRSVKECRDLLGARGQVGSQRWAQETWSTTSIKVDVSGALSAYNVVRVTLVELVGMKGKYASGGRLRLACKYMTIKNQTVQFERIVMGCGMRRTIIGGNDWPFDVPPSKLRLLTLSNGAALSNAINIALLGLLWWVSKSPLLIPSVRMPCLNFSSS